MEDRVRQANTYYGCISIIPKGSLAPVRKAGRQNIGRAPEFSKSHVSISVSEFCLSPMKEYRASVLAGKV